MPTKTYDVIVIGTGAGGGMALHTLCKAGLTVCALNGSRRLDPHKDFRNHKQPYDMPFRGFGDPQKAKNYIGYMDNEYSEGIWEHDIAFTTAPGTEWTWRRCFAVGGKTNFWGRSSARFSDIDFKAASLDGYDVDWPVTYDEIAPYYSRVEKLIGVASTVQNRPSNPDGEYLPAMNFRCIDRILETGANKIGIPYLPDRIAQLTRSLNGRPACHYCGNCTTGCDTGSFFSTPWCLLPEAEKSGRLDLRTNALAKKILVNREGRASGVVYVDRNTKQEVEVRGRAVIVAASCIESARIILNSGIANSSGQAGRNLCDHLYGTTARGFLPQLLGQPSFPDNVSDSTIAWLPRWQNLRNPREEKFIRGYSVYPDGGCAGFPGYFQNIAGFGHNFKREIKRRYPTTVGFYVQAPTQRSDDNYIDIDPTVKDIYGIPAARLHFAWDQNALLMWEHAKHATEQLIRASGGEYLGAGEIDMPGTSLHETGTLRMGNDPKKFVTDRFGRTHDVPNLYICDASVFPNCTDKTTTLSILAFSLRSSEHLIEQSASETHHPRRSLTPLGNNKQSEVNVKEQDPISGRRDFLKTSGAIAAGVVSGFPAIIKAQTVTNSIKVGLVGSGGRGTGAAAQALHADDYAELWSVADIDQSRIDASLDTLGKEPIAARLKVDKDRQYLGLDAYQKVINSGADVIILTTPPGFRPVHLAACIDANKHVFCEKPIATDAPGVRSVLATSEKARAKNLSLVSGFCWRYNDSIVEAFDKMHSGAIGRPVAHYATYYTSPVKPMPPESSRPAGMSDTEWQIRNWYNFVWLCGDSIVEQAIHSVDKVAWLMKDEAPVSCVAVGGREIPAEGGNIFDHFSVNYLYPNGFRAFVVNRQTEGCFNENADYIMGSDGTCTLKGSLPPRIEGKTTWTWSGPKYDMYQREHDRLFAAIRKNQPINNGKRMATSTLLGMMGRFAAYTGQQITWDQAMNSQESLVPEHLDWHGNLPVLPRAKPGVTKFL